MKPEVFDICKLFGEISDNPDVVAKKDGNTFIQDSSFSQPLFKMLKNTDPRTAEFVVAACQYFVKKWDEKTNEDLYFFSTASNRKA